MVIKGKKKKKRGKFASLCVKDGKFRFLNDVWLPPVGTELCPRLSSTPQTSFCPDLFQASLFQLEELARGRKPAEGPVFGGTVGAGLSAGIWGRCLEKHRAVGGPQRRE